MMRRVDSFGGGFVEILPEFAPEAVEHEFGGGLASGLLGNEVWIEVNIFPLLQLPYVLSLVCGSGDPAG